MQSLVIDNLFSVPMAISPGLEWACLFAKWREGRWSFAQISSNGIIISNCFAVGIYVHVKVNTILIWRAPPREHIYRVESNFVPRGQAKANIYCSPRISFRIFSTRRNNDTLASYILSVIKGILILYRKIRIFMRNIIPETRQSFRPRPEASSHLQCNLISLPCCHFLPPPLLPLPFTLLALSLRGRFHHRVYFCGTAFFTDSFNNNSIEGWLNPENAN